MNEQEINKYVETQQKNQKTLASYLGRKVEDVRKELGQASRVDTEKSAAKALTRLQAGLKAGETVYAGSAHIYGFVRGGIDANVYFGDAGNYGFSGSMWTSPIEAGGGGAGPWTMTPSDGQVMEFTWFGGALAGGGIGIFWHIEEYGTVVGAMDIVVAGIGGGGGHGSGVWHKG
jgi:hypothetical protein